MASGVTSRAYFFFSFIHFVVEEARNSPTGFKAEKSFLRIIISPIQACYQSYLYFPPFFLSTASICHSCPALCMSIFSLHIAFLAPEGRRIIQGAFAFRETAFSFGAIPAYSNSALNGRSLYSHIPPSVSPQSPSSLRSRLYVHLRAKKASPVMDLRTHRCARRLLPILHVDAILSYCVRIRPFGFGPDVVPAACRFWGFMFCRFFIFPRCMFSTVTIEEIKCIYAHSAIHQQLRAGYMEMRELFSISSLFSPKRLLVLIASFWFRVGVFSTWGCFSGEERYQMLDYAHVDWVVSGVVQYSPSQKGKGANIVKIKFGVDQEPQLLIFESKSSPRHVLSRIATSTAKKTPPLETASYAFVTINIQEGGASMQYLFLPPVGFFDITRKKR